MTLSPSRMSLPTAAALPVKSMQGFSYAARQRMIRQGIVTALQLAEIASRNPAQLKQRTGVTVTKARTILEAELGPLPDFTNVGVSAQPLPAAGIPTSDAPAPGDGPSTSKDIVAELNARLDGLGPLPTRIWLGNRLDGVRNQGVHPTCVGQTIAGAREYTLQQPMSAAYAYLGSKMIDGYAGGGTWLYYALQWQYQTGQVPEAILPYNKVVLEPSLETMDAEAAARRTQGHSWLLVHHLARQRMPEIMKALLAGKLIDGLGPVPVAVSLSIYDSFVSTASALDGLIPMPLENEATRGGHAMLIVGSVDADDPDNPFGLDYFVLRNSWGQHWASQCPLADPGHALMPADYFRSRDLHEAYVLLDQQSWVQH